MFKTIIESISSEINMNASFQRKLVNKIFERGEKQVEEDGRENEEKDRDFDDKISKEINERITSSLSKSNLEKEDSNFERENSNFEREDSNLDYEKDSDFVKEQQQKTPVKESFEIEVKPKSKTGKSKKASESKLSTLKISPEIIKPKVINIEASVMKKVEEPTRIEHMKNKELRDEIKKIDPKFSLSKVTTKEALLETLKMLIEKKNEL